MNRERNELAYDQLADILQSCSKLLFFQFDAMKFLAVESVGTLDRSNVKKTPSILILLEYMYLQLMLIII